MSELSADLKVFTFKEGLLSRIAHDLQLTLGRFEIRLEEGKIEATFWPATLEVDGAVRNGSLDRRILSVGDRRKIQRTIREEILETTRHPEVQFRGRLEEQGASVAGELALRGQTGTIMLRPTGSGSTRRLSTELVPSRYGIKPYRAMAGTLKLKDRVRVELTLDWPDEVPDPTTATLAWNRG